MKKGGEVMGRKVIFWIVKHNSALFMEILAIERATRESYFNLFSMIQQKNSHLHCKLVNANLYSISYFTRLRFHRGGHMIESFYFQDEEK